MMIIHHIKDSEAQQDELEEIVRHFALQVKNEVITPTLIQDLSEEYFNATDGGVIVIQDDNEIVNGILSYELFRCWELGLAEIQHSLFLNIFPIIGNHSGNNEDDNYNNNNNKLQFDLSKIPGFCRSGPTDIYAFIGEMESFKPGTGKKLLEELRSEQNLNGIFLQSLTNAKKFYEKNGFQETGLYGCPSLSLPIMVWTASGRY